MLYNQQFHTQINPPKAFFILLNQKKRTGNINLMRSGTRKPACFPKYTPDYHKHKRLTNIRTVQINVFLSHVLKTCCFISLCDYLFICLLIYFHRLGCRGHVFDVLPWQSLRKGEEGCCSIQVKGRRKRHVDLFAAAL